MDVDMDARMRERVDALFTAIDAQDAERFVEFLTEDGEFVFGSSPPVRGRAQVAEAVDGFFGSIAGLWHDIQKAWEVPGSIIVEGVVRYSRHDGSEVELPFADILDLDGELIASYKIYMDIAPLFAEQ